MRSLLLPNGSRVRSPYRGGPLAILNILGCTRGARFYSSVLPRMLMKSLISFLAVVLLPVAGLAQWRSVSVPGAEEPAGYGTYRAWLKPHSSFFASHERDLFGESVILMVRDRLGAHEVRINGILVGSGGEFPPNYSDGRSGNHRHKVPSGTFVKDQWNEVVIRVYSPSGGVGFSGEAPFFMNYFMECSMAGEWEFLAGETASISGRPQVEVPERAHYDSWRESSSVLGRAETLERGPSLSPEDSLAAFSTPEDLAVDLMLHEPLVAQPTHLSFDERGRLWVSQYRQYPYPAGLKMISRDRFYRSHYDRIPDPPPHHPRGADRITIHEDSDRDGVYDRHRVFVDGLNLANAAVRGRGGVWVMQTPYLLFYPDADFDDVPDGDPVVHLEGFGFEDTHSVANGLVWGMDGWLYGAQGSTVSCRVLRPGIDAADEGVSFVGCMVWRYHPESRDFELFAQGGGNNFGLEIDAQGRLFTGHNGSQTRGFHYVQGGQYLMQGVSPGKFGPPANPYAFGYLPQMESEDPIVRFTHFAAVVEGSALPPVYQGQFFALDPLHNFVIGSRRLVRGATFRTVDHGKVLTSRDSAFRPVFLTNAPDGSLFVADFYEHYIAHGQHYQSQIDPSTGRVFRLRGRALPLETDWDLASKNTDELIDLLGHPNKWHRQTAVRLLGERRDAERQSALRERIVGHEALTALNALWAHYQAFGLDDDLAEEALGHSYAPLRYWVVRLACDDGEVSAGLLASLVAMASEEANAEVRSQIAASASRLPVDQAVVLAQPLLAFPDAMSDPYLPAMIWWVWEAHMEESPEPLLAFFQSSEHWDGPLVADHLAPRVMRWLVTRGRSRDFEAARVLLGAAPSLRARQGLIQAFETAMAGRAQVTLPDELVAELVAGGRPSLVLRVQLGDEQAVEAALARILDATVDSTERLTLVRAFGELRTEAAVEPLLGLVESGVELEVRRAGLVALGAIGGEAVGRELVGLLDRFPTPLQEAAVEVVLSRSQWMEYFVRSIVEGRVARGFLSSERLRELQEQSTSDVKDLLARLEDGSDEPDPKEDVWSDAAAIRRVLDEEPGDPYAGEQHFLTRCGTCHRLFFKGGNLGPDLTHYQRDNLETMLTSIVDPNAEIREGFEYVSLETKDGRTLSGFLVDQDARRVVLRTLVGEDVRVERDGLVSVSGRGRSLMPEGLLGGLDPQGLRDLFAFLRQSQPITN